MAHGTAQANFGLGDANDSHLATALLDDDFLDIDAADIDIADAGGYTAETTLEAALQEVYSRLPYTIDQHADLVIDTTVGDGSTLRATTLVAPVLASTKYAVEATVYVTATVNSGWKLGFTAPSGATLGWSILAFDVDNDFDQDGEQAIGDSHGATAAVDFMEVRMSGLLIVDSTAGNLTVVAAQNADHADDTVIHLESWLRVTKVA
jgi:hypothetical protein